MKERLMEEIAGISFKKPELESFRTKRKNEKEEDPFRKRIIREIAGIPSSVWSTEVRREEQKFNLEKKEIMNIYFFDLNSRGDV